MTDELLARILCQAIAYGELMLTIEELGAYWQWTTEHPAAAFLVGPGRLLVVEQIPVRVLELA